MSDPRYIIEISTTTTDAGVVNVKRIGELALTTTDPVEADQFRNTLAGLLRQPGVLDGSVVVALQMETVERRLVLCAMDENYFRDRARDNAKAAIADREGGAASGFDREMNEQAAALKSLTRLDNWLAGDAGEPSAREWGDIALSLDYYELLTPYLRDCLRRSNNMSMAEYQRALRELSTTVRKFPLKHIEPVDTDRWLAVGAEMRQHSPDARSKPDAKACERESDLDYAACKGRVIETTFVNAFDLGTNNQNDHVTSLDEPPYRVIVVGADDTPSQWNDDTLDPKWDVIPAPDEDRLDGLRSLWTFGPSYRDATLSQKEG